MRYWPRTFHCRGVQHLGHCRSQEVTMAFPCSAVLRVDFLVDSRHSSGLRAGEMVGEWRTTILHWPVLPACRMRVPCRMHVASLGRTHRDAYDSFRTLEANEEFMALWLQELDQPNWPWNGPRSSAPSQLRSRRTSEQPQSEGLRQGWHS